MEKWVWPQWLVIGYMVLVLVYQTINHGKPADHKINAYVRLLNNAITFYVLYQGGFF